MQLNTHNAMLMAQFFEVKDNVFHIWICISA